MPLDAQQRLLDRASSILEKTAAAILWKYVDPDGKNFYLSERVTGAIKSPHTGKSFTPKPERQSLSEVAKDLKTDEVKLNGVLWKYADPEGGEFYLPERVTGTIKSPRSGKSFPARAEKFTMGEVGKELKSESGAEKTAAGAILWKYIDPSGDPFYLLDRQLGTIKSPYTGRAFTPKPLRQSLTDVAKELREKGTRVLWKYVDPEGKEFFSPTRSTGTIKSPFTGQGFPAKAERFTLGEVGKEIKLEANPDPDLLAMQTMLSAKGYDPAFATTLHAEGMGSLELEERLKDKAQFEVNYNVPKLASIKTHSPESKKLLASEILQQGEAHPAIAAIRREYDAVVAGIKEAARVRAASSEVDGTSLVLGSIQPKVAALGKTASVVARQLQERLG